MSEQQFQVGQRVRPSAYGIKMNIFHGKKGEQRGIVQRVDSFNTPSILWDNRKTRSTYHPSFIELDKP